MTGERQVDGADSSGQPKRNIVQRMETALAKILGPSDAYHPEQHYLRGRPGPKAQAKQRHDHEK